MEFPVFWFVPFSSSVFLDHHWHESDLSSSVFFISPFPLYIHMVKRTLYLFKLNTHSTLSFAMGSSPLIIFLVVCWLAQWIYIYLFCTGEPRNGHRIQMCHASDKQREKVTFFWSAVSALPDGAQEAAFQLISPQPVLLDGVFLPRATSWLLFFRSLWCSCVPAYQFSQLVEPVCMGLSSHCPWCSWFLHSIRMWLPYSILKESKNKLKLWKAYIIS